MACQTCALSLLLSVQGGLNPSPGDVTCCEQGHSLADGRAVLAAYDMSDLCSFISFLCRDSKSVCDAGHSLGGVMAVLAAYDISDLCPWRSVQVYTVGAPRPGNKAFANKYEARVPDTWHVINITVSAT